MTLTQINAKIVMPEIPAYLAADLSVIAYRQGHTFGQKRFLYEIHAGYAMRPQDIPCEFLGDQVLMDSWVEGEVVGYNLQLERYSREDWKLGAPAAR